MRDSVATRGQGRRRAGAPVSLSAAVVLTAVLLLVPRAAHAAPPPPKTGAGADTVEKIEEGPEKPAGEKSDSEDIVETLEEETPSGPAQTKKKVEVEVPKPVDKFEFRGFTRLTISSTLAPPQIAPQGAPPVERVGTDRAFLEQHGYIDLRYSRGSHFQAVLSGSLAYAAYLTEARPGPVDPERSVEFGRLEPALREVYIGVYSKRLDFRIGQQRIVWGNSEGITPNDVLNARDLRDRMQFDTEMIHQPTLAARADLDLGVAVLGLVVQPFYTPDKFSLYGNNWSLIQGDAPRTYRKLFGLYAQGRDRTLIEDVQTSLVSARAPKSALDAGSVGSSLRFHFGSVDASFYYHYGFDRTPYLYLDPQLVTQLDAADPAKVNGTVLDVFLRQLQTASAAYGGPLVLTYVRRHHVGLDTTTTVGPFVLRIDGAYDSATVFFSRQTLNSIVKPSAQGVLGIEYSPGDLSKLVLIEGWYQRVLGPAVPLVPVLNQANSGPLLFVEDDNVGISTLLRWSFIENTIVQTNSFVGVQPLWYLVRAELGYNTPAFTIRLGAMTLGGHSGSYGDYYRRNDSIYITTRYAF